MQYPAFSVSSVSSAFKVLLLGMLPFAASGAQTPTPELARERLAQISGTLETPGLDSAVEVRRDRWGVPHIYARTQHDLFFAQGFVAAQDRLFQMEMWRRMGDGKLAEVLGPSLVARDRFARLLRYRGDMEAEWRSYAADTRVIVTAFVAGVNAYIDRVRDRPPVEFTLLGFAPEHWNPEVPLQRLAALSMTLNADTEVLRAQLVEAIGVDRANALVQTIPRRALDPAPGLSFRGVTTSSLGAFAAATGPVPYPRVTGSNNWVVSGALTTTGKPLLANDPHRYLDSPALRYLTHLVGPGWNVIGAGEPGVPGVAAGHNERIGFGFTIVMMDQQDVYVETLGPCPGMPRRRCYLNGGAWKPLRLIIDTIPVKGAAGQIVRLEFTEHGPIVGEDTLEGADGRSRAFALRFVGSEPGTAGYLAQLSVNRATDWASFGAAAERWKLPTENLVYADVDGNIGWIAAGLMPKRHWSGLLPVPGTGGYEWTGFRTPAELPRSFNPPTGYVVTANHDIRPKGYDIPLSFEFSPAHRAQRIAELLDEHRAGRRFGVSDFQRMQHDELSLQARALVPQLIAAAGRAGVAQRWEFTTLRGWDFVMRADLVAPALFETWRRSVSAAAVRLVAQNEVAAAILGESWLDESPTPDGPLAAFSPATRDSLFLTAMARALAVLRERLGADSTGWRWGRLHTAGFPHRLAASYDLAPVERGGNGHTVNSTAGSDYRQQYGASFREILDFADWDRSVATSVPGQSGQPGSEFYSNLLPLWSRGEYFPLVFSRAAVERETRYVLWLTPPLPRQGEHR
jgi:penicillin G amidase